MHFSEDSNRRSRIAWDDVLNMKDETVFKMHYKFCFNKCRHLYSGSREMKITIEFLQDVTLKFEKLKTYV